ncbi:MAG TPA: hypothetical protein VF221_12205 [Chloroflexota bacterium]
MIYEAANFVLLRLKAYTRDVDIKPAAVNTVTWRLDYLTDDLGKMPSAHPVLWDRSSVAIRGSIGITPAKVWNSLPVYWDENTLQTWESLLMDAIRLLPDVGPAIVLAYSALETAIAVALDSLVPTSSVPEQLWLWLHDRGNDFRKWPSVAEQWNDLLKVLTGHSLMDQRALWQTFQSLRHVRNEFAHKGLARAKGKSEEISEKEARKLIDGAREIIDWIYPLLDPSFSRPNLESTLTVHPQKKRS